MMHGHKIYCMMNSGKQLTKALADALLFNAYDMFDENRHTQRIKSRKYDGVIESNLEVIEYLGVPSVVFDAIVSTDMFEGNEVKFVVRVDDLDGVELGEWASTHQKTMTVSFDELPEEIQQAILGRGDNDNNSELN